VHVRAGNEMKRKAIEKAADVTGNAYRSTALKDCFQRYG